MRLRKSTGGHTVEVQIDVVGLGNPIDTNSQRLVGQVGIVENNHRKTAAGDAERNLVANEHGNVLRALREVNANYGQNGAFLLDESASQPPDFSFSANETIFGQLRNHAKNPRNVIAQVARNLTIADRMIDKAANLLEGIGYTRVQEIETSTPNKSAHAAAHPPRHRQDIAPSWAPAGSPPGLWSR